MNYLLIINFILIVINVIMTIRHKLHLDRGLKEFDDFCLKKTIDHQKFMDSLYEIQGGAAIKKIDEISNFFNDKMNKKD